MAAKICWRNRPTRATGVIRPFFPMGKVSTLVLTAAVSGIIGATLVWTYLRDGSPVAGASSSIGNSGTLEIKSAGIPDAFAPPRSSATTHPSSAVLAKPAVEGEPGAFSGETEELLPIGEGPTGGRTSGQIMARPVSLSGPRMGNSRQTTISPVALRGFAKALSVAENFAAPREKEGFMRRDDSWTGVLDASQQVITHQLFKGNEYWFWAATDTPQTRIDIHAYDGRGDLVEVEHWQVTGAAACRVIPKASGTYHLVVSGRTAEQALLQKGAQVHWAVIYAFR